MKKKLISFFTVFCLLVTSASENVFDLKTSAVEDMRKYVIFDAEPLKAVSGEDNSATPDWAKDAEGHSWTFGYKASGRAYVSAEQSCAAYRCVITGDGEKNGAVIESGFLYNEGKYKGWINHRCVLEAIAPYITVEYDVRIDSGGEPVNIVIAPMPEWTSEAPSVSYGCFDSFQTDGSGDWIRRSGNGVAIIQGANGQPHWSCADLLVSVDDSFTEETESITVELRKIRFTVSEKDRELINAALENVEGIDGLSWFTGDYAGVPLDDLPERADGKTDYYKMLTLYDRQSSYNSNCHSVYGAGEYEGGSISVPEGSFYENESVTVTAVPNDGYVRTSFSAITESGRTVDTVQTGKDNFLFTIPSENVTVKAEFQSRDFSENKRYVIFEANPSKVSETDGDSAKPQWAVDESGHFWTFGYKSSGSAFVKYDDETTYYSFVLNAAGEKNGTAVESGFEYNKGNYQGWIIHRCVLEALAEYIYVSYEIRATADTSVAYNISPIPEWTTGAPSDEYGIFDSFEISGDGQWISRISKGITVKHTENGDPHWSCADLFISADETFSAEDVKIDIRGFRLVLSESDRENVNSTLRSIQGIDTLSWFTGDWQGSEIKNLPKDGDGNTDYFEMLIQFDASAEYNEGYPVSVDQDTSPHGEVYMTQSAQPGDTVAVTAVPEVGFELNGISVKKSNGESLQIFPSENGCQFIMPDAAVFVAADFESVRLKDENRYVIWESQPESISFADGADAFPFWREENSFVSSLKGSATIKTDESIPYYRIRSASNETSESAVIGGAALKSGALLYNSDVFSAIAQYLRFEGEIRINTGPNMVLKPTVRIYPVSSETCGAPGWEIGSFLYYDEWKGNYEVSRWVEFESEFTLSQNSSRLFWDGDLYISLSYDSSDVTSPSQDGSSLSEPITVDLRALRLTVDESDRESIDAALEKLGIDDGFEKITSFDNSSRFTYRSAAGDVNGDGEILITDLIRLKKMIAGTGNYGHYTAADINSDRIINSEDFVLLTKRLFGQLAVFPATFHPGAVNCDAEYDMIAFSDFRINDEDVIFSASDDKVKINGSHITVPYSVRSSNEELTVTAVSSSGEMGSYTFDFISMSEEPSFTENFDDGIDGWVYSSDSSPGYLEDGKLVFRVDEEGPEKFCLYTERFKQAYGCFSAAMKMPETGTANASFFMTGERFNINPYMPYNSFGEIDVVEYYSTWGENWAGTLHWYLWNPDMYQSSGNEELYGEDIKNGFHTYSVVWTDSAIYWYYDYKLCRIYDGPGVTSGSGPMELILQLRPDYEDGWGGAYDPTAYPYEMRVDWVNVWSITE